MWTTEEEVSLVRFLLSRGYKHAWPKPSPPCTKMWEDAARHLAELGHRTKRTSKNKHVCTE